MLLYTMLYIVLAYLMLFAALTNSVCLNNASFFFLFKYFLCQGYELSGEIALKNNHYYYIIIITSSEPVFNPIGVLSSAVYTRQTNRVILRIPKSCRIQAASALSDIISNALSSQTPLSWTKLFFFAMKVLGIPTHLAMTTELQ